MSWVRVCKYMYNKQFTVSEVKFTIGKLTATGEAEDTDNVDDAVKHHLYSSFIETD